MSTEYSGVFKDILLTVVKLKDKSMDNVKADILSKYDIMAKAYYNRNSTDGQTQANVALWIKEIESNQVIFNYISHELMYNILSTEKEKFSSITIKSPELAKMLSSKGNFNNIISTFTTPVDVITAEGIGTILETYGMTNSESDDEGYVEEVPDGAKFDEVPNLDTDTKFSIEDDEEEIARQMAEEEERLARELEEEESNTEVDNQEQENWGDNTELDNTEQNLSDEDIMSQSDEEILNEILDEEEKARQAEIESEGSNSDEIEKFKAIYDPNKKGPVPPLRSAVNGILQAYEDLYASCYSGIYFPDGILTSKGILSFDKSAEGHRRFLYNHNEEGSVEYYSTKSVYDRLYKSIMYAAGVVAGGKQRVNNTDDQATREATIKNAIAAGEAIIGSEIDGRKDTTPKYADAIIRPSMYPRFHTEIMTGYLAINKKMREWAVENKAKRNEHKITSFKSIMEWARKRVSDCLVQACIDNGVKIEEVGSNDGTIISICQTMSQSLKNIIAITNAKDSYYTIKICTNEKINAVKLAEEIANYSNLGSDGALSTSVKLKNDGTTSGVIEFDLIYDIEDYDKPASFSADVIDNVIESGQVPSWSNAIMGEKDNGGTLTFDFKSHCGIAIYGATGSGKGIMTSALLTNAMAEGCAIYYFDGKPDNGAALAKIGWDEGVGDVPIFNGKFGGSTTFQSHIEEYSHGIRDVSWRNFSLENIPYMEGKADWPFNKEDNRRKLAELTLTLQGFQFIHDMIRFRTQNENLEYLPNGEKRWAVFIIDEIQDAASTEHFLVTRIKEYMEKVGKEDVYITETKETRNGTVQQQKKDGKIRDKKNWHRDTGYLFCVQYLDWLNNCCSDWTEIATKTLRQSSSTLITIFQTNDWLNENNLGRSTKIGRMILEIVGKTIKIVGANALKSTGIKWKDRTDYKWVNEVNKGKWALAQTDGILDEDACIFKPFRVFTTDAGKDVMIPVDDYGAGAGQCRQVMGGEGKPPLGLQSYSKYLFNGLANELQLQLEQGARLEGTLTPAGVLATSYTYFDKVISGNTGKSLLDYMYKVEPIYGFSGQVTEEQATRMEENLSTQDSLNALNEGIDGYTGGQQRTETGFNENDADDNDLDDILSGGRGQQPQQHQQPQPQRQIQLPVMIKYTDVLRLSPQLQAKIMNKVRQETLRANFNISIPTIKTRFGVAHLCYNLSILFGFNMANLNNINRTLHTFASNYFDRLSQGTFDFDYVPTTQYELDELLSRNSRNNQPTPVPTPSQSGGMSFNGGDTFNGGTFGGGQNPIAGDESPITLDDDETIFVNPGINPSNYTDNPQDIDNNATVSHEVPTQPSFGRDNNGRTVWNNPSANIPGTNIIGLGESNFVDSEPISQEGGFWGMLGKTHRGQKQILSRRNDYLIDMILRKMKNPAEVRRLQFEENGLAVNGLLVNTDVVTDDERGIRLIDIIDIRKILKCFKNVNTVTIDSPMFQQLVIQMGDSDNDVQNVWNIFKTNPSLQTLNIQMSPGSGFDTITRRDFRQNAGKVGQMTQEARFRKNTDFMASVHNPRLNERGMGERNSAFEIAGSLGNNAKKKLTSEHPNIWAGAGYGALALVAGGAGIVIGLGNGLVRLIRRR